MRANRRGEGCQSRDHDASSYSAGSKIIMISHQNVKFIDSINFLLCPLRKLPKTFGLADDVKKGFFPFLYVNKTNLNYVGPLPDTSYYDPQGIKPDEHALFVKWYEEE